jgi:hypothetical protein
MKHERGGAVMMVMRRNYGRLSADKQDMPRAENPSEGGEKLESFAIRTEDKANDKTKGKRTIDKKSAKSIAREKVQIAKRRFKYVGLGGSVLHVKSRPWTVWSKEGDE